MGSNEDELGDVAELRLQYGKVMQTESFLTSTRLLAGLLKENPYITVHKYLELVSDSELQVLVDRIDKYKRDVEELGEENAGYGVLEEVLVLAEMLSTAEGVKSQSLDDVQENLNSMTAFILCESLARKGLADVIRENMSFDQQYRHLAILRAK